jgi:hypothetical protein
MSDRAKKLTELPSVGTSNTSIASGDIFIVEHISTGITSAATLSTLRKAVVQGPYADNTAANTAGVALGQMYYTAAGDVKVRTT